VAPSHVVLVWRGLGKRVLVAGAGSKHEAGVLVWRQQSIIGRLVEGCFE